MRARGEDQHGGAVGVEDQRVRDRADRRSRCWSPRPAAVRHAVVEDMERDGALVPPSGSERGEHRLDPGWMPRCSDEWLGRRSVRRAWQLVGDVGHALDPSDSREPRSEPLDGRAVGRGLLGCMIRTYVRTPPSGVSRPVRVRRIASAGTASTPVPAERPPWTSASESVAARRFYRSGEASCMRSYDEPIEVRRGLVAGQEAPEQFLWRGRLWVVRDVVSHWVETGAWWDQEGIAALLGVGAGPNRAGLRDASPNRDLEVHRDVRGSDRRPARRRPARRVRRLAGRGESGHDGAAKPRSPAHQATRSRRRRGHRTADSASTGATASSTWPSTGPTARWRLVCCVD